MGFEFEVFLSFSGKDVRTGFADYLYNDLIDASFRTFRDNEELRVGEKLDSELLRAIQTSKIAIPIFSKTYASSKWCMLELVKMVECMKSKGQMLLPVFYDVEPGHVRHQEGCYEAAFDEHEKWYDDATLDGWRKALHEVGGLKGLELKKTADGHEGRLVKMIVEKVWKELKTKYSAVVSHTLVGIDSHVNEMMKLLRASRGGVQVIVVKGMPGIGKTTIAEVLYDRVSEGFDCCCFLRDIREASSQPLGVVHLQNQLIREVLKHQNLSLVNSVVEGMNTISESFPDKKLLIVLDDVDSAEQLNALAKERKWFGSGSRIIVTTRSTSFLRANQFDGIYEPDELKGELPLQLFSKHAFRADYPPEDYLQLSKDIVSTAAGLPLALEIIGSCLSGQKRNVWDRTLMKLKSVPHEEVENKLRVSYDALIPRLKSLFLDIACFFIGEDKDTVVYMYDPSLHAEDSIEALTLKSFVKIGQNNELKMHDQLRDLGREIVRQKSEYRPAKQSRLWSHEEALDVLKAHEMSEEVEALCLNFYKNSALTKSEFETLPSLRYLQVDRADLKGDFRGLLSKLRWLRWRYIQYDYTSPRNFHLVDLRVLDLSHSSFTHHWFGWDQMKAATRLKVLNLSCCHAMSRSPDFSAFVNLEELLLNNCQSLTRLDPSIWKLTNLRRLDLRRTAVEKIPNGLGMLQNLEVLDASYNTRLTTLPDSIGNLKCLRKLNLDVTNIATVPERILLVSQLESLILCCDSKIESLPELPQSLVCLQLSCFMRKCIGLLKLIRLEELHLKNCHMLEEITSEIHSLSSLRSLKLEACKGLRIVLGLPLSLRNLEFSECSQLIEIGGFQNLLSLKQLCLLHCWNLLILDGLSMLKSLENLCIAECSSIATLPDLSFLMEMRAISISYCSKLRVIRGLDRLQSLTSVEVIGCSKPLSLSILQQVSDLKMLVSYNCMSTAALNHIEILKILENVKGPCLISGRLSWPPSNLQKARQYSISYQRNSSSEFRTNSFKVRNGGIYRFICRDGETTTRYSIQSIDAGCGGNRELEYSCEESGHTFRLNYGGKHAGSFMNYVPAIDEGFCNAVCSNTKPATFELRIKEERTSGRVAFPPQDDAPPSIRLAVLRREDRHRT